MSNECRPYRSAGSLLRFFALLICMSLVSIAKADGVTTQFMFSDPNADLILAADGNFYGVAFNGGTRNSNCPDGCGYVFKLSRDGQQTILHSFTGGADGSSPESLVQDANGNFYGTTWASRASCNNACGTLFKLSQQGVLTTIHTFSGGVEGSNPKAIGFSNDGMLFLTVNAGDALDCPVTSVCDIIYTWSSSGTSSSGTLSKVHAFIGADDSPDLIGQADNVLYFVSDQAGVQNCVDTTGARIGCGAVYSLNANGVLTTVYAFTGGEDGGQPRISLGIDGKFYGTTSTGGMLSGCGGIGCGTVFRLTPAGVKTVLQALAESQSGEVFAPQVNAVATDGTVFGSFAWSGTGSSCNKFRCGAVFKVTASGAYTIIHMFSGDVDGTAPLLISGHDGNLYGVNAIAGEAAKCASTLIPNAGCGTVVKMTPTGELTTLYTFTGKSDGAFPDALYAGEDGNLYGTTAAAGNGAACGSIGCGTLFKVALTNGPATPPVIPAAPVSVSATAGEGQVMLTWSPVVGADGYNVYQGTASGEANTAVRTGVASTSVVITGLTNGTTYYFKIAAVNTAGASPLSNEVSATPTTLAGTPPGGQGSETGGNSSGGSETGSGSTGGGGGAIELAALLMLVGRGLRRRRTHSSG